ncbi:coiled-coil domain-containing protein 33 isoform X1 [Betta splendens]|uniref:Coiled-coil domain-containing protein 33 isoform X1 n=2 Tax=Betta splendens TaxID=158456 RepID=A0A6P7MRE6_BETSP|nr:coiled-coil domain-containing protein 33 isoform X1 [Betta splendens]
MKASEKTKSVSGSAAVKELKRHNRPQTSTLQEDGYNLPSHDALAQLLPRYLASGGKAEVQEQNKPDTHRTHEAHHAHKRASLSRREFEDDPQMSKVNDLQTKELENYRAAMSKMAEDIILLRTQTVELEAENSRLRGDLSLHQDLGRDLLKDTDIDVMTKAEMSDRIASLKLKLASQTSEAAAQRDRIQQLQNELIRRNDGEKELLKLQRLHRQQEQLQQQHSSSAKMATLEATVKQQETVIEKLEKAFNTKIRRASRQSGDKRLAPKKPGGERGPRRAEVEAALAAENAGLRAELDRTRLQPPAVIIQQAKEALPLREKLSLLSRLEKAEARVQSLEAQLQQNCKVWGRQKQDMLNKLSERKQGLVHNSSLFNE